MKITKILIAVALAASASMPIAAQSSIQNPMTQAVLAVYEEELRENPNDYNILMSRADEYYRHDEYIRALADVDKVIQLAPASEEDVRFRAYVLRAGIYNETKRPEQALQDLRAAVEIDPNSYNVVYQKANTEFMLGRYAEARLDFQKLQRLNPRGTEAYIGLARVAVKENNLGTANEMLASAVNLDPNNAEIYVRRASVRRMMGDHNGAVDDLILAISSDNKHPRAMQELIDYGNTNYPATMAGLSKAVSEVEVIYVPTDNTAASNAELISNVCVPAGVPVVAGEEGICAGCGVATLSISYYDLGVATGKMAARILKGEDISTMPIEYAPNFTKKYNASVCEQLNITVPEGYVAIGE